MVRFALRLFMSSFICFSLQLQAQENNITRLKDSEDSCIFYLKKLPGDATDEEKLAVNTEVSKILKRALNNPGSFDYPFDSLKTMGRFYAPDKVFRVFTWNVVLKNCTHRYFGLIQVFNPKNNSSQVFELTDRADEIQNPEHSVLSAGKWFGALYYKILRNKIDNRVYYTLLALQYHTLVTTRKMIEVLYFDEWGNPVFGAPIVQVGNNMRHRMVFEYSSLSAMNLKYDNDLKMIIFDHLAPPEPKFNGQFEYYGPDLTFDGLAFKKDRWIYKSNLDLRRATDPPVRAKPVR